tara:strand:+ start:2133 stop:2804 length:672 start_codon:yes stop_codon:yes gene_type:complete
MDLLSNFQSDIVIELGYIDLFFNLIIAAALAWTLEYFFINYSQTINNKKVFSKNFILIATTTAFIISIVKSSLALSLGLVGALSIIRFRTAIKEPEELSYLFICIGIGLGLGAGYRIVTVIAVVFIFIIILIRSKFDTRELSNETIYLTLYSTKKLNLEEILLICKSFCTEVYLRDFDFSNSKYQIGLIVNFENEKKLNSLVKSLKTKYKDLELNLINKQNII